MKKTWHKPELIELYRGSPDENLLQDQYCKAGVPGRNKPDNAAGTFCGFDHGGRAGDPCYTHSLS